MNVLYLKLICLIFLSASYDIKINNDLFLNISASVKFWLLRLFISFILLVLVPVMIYNTCYIGLYIIIASLIIFNIVLNRYCITNIYNGLSNKDIKIDESLVTKIVIAVNNEYSYYISQIKSTRRESKELKRLTKKIMNKKCTNDLLIPYIEDDKDLLHIDIK